MIHLVSEGTIEHKMISTLASKQALSDGILDLRGDLKKIKMGGGRQAFLAKLEQLIAPARSLAVENRLPEPAGLEDVLLPPLSQHFGEALTILRIFSMDAAAPWEPASDALKKWAEPL